VGNINVVKKNIGYWSAVNLIRIDQLHVAENVDKLIDIAGAMAKAVNDFDREAELLKAGRTKTEIADAYKKDAKFREVANALLSGFVARHNEIKMDLWRIKGAATRLNPAPGAATDKLRGKGP
jgi:hypothetical protein